jgi:hypothetical protein
MTEMKGKSEHEKVWYLALTNYEESEFHYLSINDLRELLEAEWDQHFNGIFIGRDVDCVGRLGVFFLGESAFVAYEDFDTGECQVSFDLTAIDRQDWDRMVRLTPEDTQEYSFRQCNLIPKPRAWEIVDSYVSSGSLDGLFLSSMDGKPLIESDTTGNHFLYDVGL